MSRSEHFTSVTTRNALRREARLPLLDVRTEVDHLAALDRWQEWLDLRERFAADRSEIEARVRAEQATRGRDLASTGGRWLLGLLVGREFDALLARKGFVKPPAPRRNAVVYGEAR